MKFSKTFNILLVAVACVILFLAALITSYALPIQDFAQYWAAAHLFPKDPYAMQATPALERSAGIVAAPLVTKTPPWAIVLLLPLALLGYHPAFALWTVMSVCVIAGCARVVWNRLDSKASLAPALLSLFFGPTVVLLMLGQFTVLVLLGAILFGIMARKRSDWLAGASLLLVFGKPHIALLFLVAVILWAGRYRRWTILVSGTLTLATASITALAINPHIFMQFWRRTILVVNETESYPNLGGMLYSVSGMHVLALLPQLVGLIWLGVYWRQHRLKWDWEQHGLIVLLISVTCSYYSYPYDEVLAIPALIAAFAKGDRRMFLAIYALTDLGYAVYISGVAGRFGYGYMFLWWTCTGWLLACVVSQRWVSGAPALSSQA